jgi:hypothetical protein
MTVTQPACPSILAGEALVRGALLRLPDFDAHLAVAITGRSPAATELAVHLLKAAVQDANPPLAGPDLPASVDVSPDKCCVIACVIARESFMLREVPQSCPAGRPTSSQPSTRRCAVLRPQILTKLASQSSGGAPLLALLDQARRGISAQQPVPPAGAPSITPGAEHLPVDALREEFTSASAAAHSSLPPFHCVPNVKVHGHGAEAARSGDTVLYCAICPQLTPCEVDCAAGPPPGEPPLPRPGSRQGPPPGVPPPVDPNEPAGLREQVRYPA